MDSSVVEELHVAETARENEASFRQGTYTVVVTVIETTVYIINFVVSSLLVFTILKSRKLRLQRHYLYILHYSVITGTNRLLTVIFNRVMKAIESSLTFECVMAQIHTLLQSLALTVLILMAVDWSLATYSPSKSIVFRKLKNLSLIVIYSLVGAVLFTSSLILCTKMHVEIVGLLVTFAFLGIFVFVVIIVNVVHLCKKRTINVSGAALGIKIPTVIMLTWILCVLSLLVILEGLLMPEVFIVFKVLVLCSPCFVLVICWWCDKNFKQCLLGIFKTDEGSDMLDVDRNHVDESNMPYGQMEG